MPVTNLIEFNAALDRFSRQLVPAQVVALHKKVHLEAGTRLVLKTPVKTGRARANWQSTEGAPATSELKLVDPTGQDAISRSVSSVSGLKPFGVTYWTNNLPYVEALEQGSSRQAPAGMLAVTVEELGAIFE